MWPGYVQGLEEAGAVPLILPLTTSETIMKEIADSLDAFLFSGGPDVNPKMYGHEKSPHCGEISEPRDLTEAYIFREAVLNQNKPALGICRGFQLINVLLGGTLYQDLPSELSSPIHHSIKDPPYGAHSVRILRESPLYKLMGRGHMEVNSFHHQGIKEIAKGLEIMAYAEDGLIEAVYMPDRFFVWAVQWHPEKNLGPQNFSLEGRDPKVFSKDEPSSRIFECFVENVKKSMGSK